MSSETDPFRYDGKRALVVGGATGMGAAAAKRVAALGAEVIAMDRAPIEYPVAQAIEVDLSDPASIDAGLDKVEGPIDALFSAAGIADGPPLMKINFIGHRHLIDRLIETERLGRGSAICFISSVAGIGWEKNLDTTIEFLETPDYETAVAWMDAHENANNYGFSKQAINTYVARQAYPLIAKGIRINAICPGPTDTPLARANADLWLTFAQDYRDATGIDHHTPEQMGDTMAFLNSDAARGISGVTLLVDSGHVMSSTSGSWEAGKPLIELLMGLTFV
jgi:NAD(P)-dependent dehydrogenase (short-subunit alcohol dehydrogenase family)